MKTKRCFLFSVGLLWIFSTAFAGETYKRPTLSKQWQKTASRITAAKRAPASIKNEIDSTELVTLDELVGKNRKSKVPRTWQYGKRD